MQKKYRLIKEIKRAEKITFSKKKMEGFKITPHNQVTYPGITVHSMLVIKPSLIEKLLKKKNQRKLDHYLQYMISLLEDDSTTDDSTTDDSAYRIALNDLTRYREIVEYKYRKYLDDKYINLLLKKIDLLEHEIKSRVIYKEQIKAIQTYEPEEKERSGKAR